MADKIALENTEIKKHNKTSLQALTITNKIPLRIEKVFSIKTGPLDQQINCTRNCKYSK